MNESSYHFDLLTYLKLKSSLFLLFSCCFSFHNTSPNSATATNNRRRDRMKTILCEVSEEVMFCVGSEYVWFWFIS